MTSSQERDVTSQFPGSDDLPTLDVPATLPADHLQHGELLYLVHELSRLVSTHFDKAMLSHKITRAQWWALMHILEHPGSTQTELADIMEMGRAATGKLLERLECNGWIERRPDPTDNRIRRVYRGGEPIAVNTVLDIEAERLFDVFLAGITDAEERRLIKGLRKIKANADRANA